MQVSDFHFDLPDELIARYPMTERTASRLLQLDGQTGALRHGQFVDVLDQLNPGDLLVFNNTRVIPARMFGQKASGGKLEVLVERMLDEHSVLAHVRSSKSPSPVPGSFWMAGLTARKSKPRCAPVTMPCSRSTSSTPPRAGDPGSHRPYAAAPYIDRPDEDADKERYQTVYNQKPGAVAAPTAGLHFDEPLLEKIRAKGVETAFVTLHVGAGTFQPVRVDKIEDHHMHSEYAEVPQEVVDAIAATRARGGRVIAVGTTSVRSLESAAKVTLAQGKPLAPFFSDTDIFIFPGYQFQVVDAMVTNFHLPESTLIMLVSAFAGYDNVMAAYQAAVAEQYRFFSYGDAMFVTRRRAQA